AFAAEDRQPGLGVYRRGRDQPLEHARLGHRPLAEGHDDVAGTQPRVRGRRAFEHLDDHHAVALADAVMAGDLFHLLLREITDAHAQPGERVSIDGREDASQDEQSDESSPHHVSSSTSASSAALTRWRRASTASVSSSSWRSTASGRNAAAARSAIIAGGWSLPSTPSS